MKGTPKLATPIHCVAVPETDRFWRIHALWPGIVFAAAFIVIAGLDLDRAIAQAWWFDAASQRWLGTGTGDWWARGMLHSQGRWLVRGIAAAALGAWVCSLLLPRCRDWRRTAGFVFCAIVLSTAVVGGLKAVTNVDCPWDLAGFGGDRPYVALLADRPDALPRARCFPGAHASSGFTLVCGYFVLLGRSRRRAKWALAVGILTGIAFSIGQEARGAHFLSHDLAAAAIVWFLQLGLYERFLRRHAAGENTARGDAGAVCALRPRVESLTSPPAGGP